MGGQAKTEPAEYSFTIAKKVYALSRRLTRNHDGTDSATGKIALSGAVKRG